MDCSNSAAFLSWDRLARVKAWSILLAEALLFFSILASFAEILSWMSKTNRSPSWAGMGVVYTMEGVNCSLRGILGLLSGIVKLKHDALDQGDSRAVVLKDARLGFGVLRAQRLLASLPAGHEMIGRQNVEEQLSGVAFELTENVGWEFVVGGAERRYPSRVGERRPVAQVSREAD